MAEKVRIKRVYDPPEPEDGRRVLVDRLWPRGVSKEAAQVDWWAREIAPSNELRRWFAHDPGKWEEFRSRYAAELESAESIVELLCQRVCHEPTTLLYAAKDPAHNNAVVLKEIIERRMAEEQSR